MGNIGEPRRHRPSIVSFAIDPRGIVGQYPEVEEAQFFLKPLRVNDTKDPGAWPVARFDLMHDVKGLHTHTRSRSI